MRAYIINVRAERKEKYNVMTGCCRLKTDATRVAAPSTASRGQTIDLVTNGIMSFQRDVLHVVTYALLRTPLLLMSRQITRSYTMTVLVGRRR